MKLRRLGQAAVVLSGGYLAALAGTRRWHQHWGASDQEITRPLPGDDLLPGARLDSTHAITIHAPAERIWPWLAQMGYEDRAGTYSYDRFERSTSRNLHRVDPDIPALASGDTMPFYPGAPMTVAVADPPSALVLWQVTAGGKAIDPAGPWGDDHVAWSWAFVLEPVEAATTRLLVRMRVSYQPAAKWAPVMWLLVEPAHFVMGRRQLLGIRQRAEAARPPDHQQRTGPPAVAGAEAAVEAVRATGPQLQGLAPV
ncbi:MAG TPA: SRPBCC family protein [Actinomycetota bacterium]|nr:SRPBCC family protein [Actinomycetota bacterium]